MALRGTEIILGVCGGIAAYKSAEFLRLLVKEGANVRVIMTKNASAFITPLTFQTLSRNPVYIDQFKLIKQSEIGHTSLAEWAKIVVIAPATANIIGKIAQGIADDLLTTSVMATKAPVLIAPSMNTNMYENPILQRNFHILREYGYYIASPESGELACGIEGMGRLIEPAALLEEVKRILTKKDLQDKRILITAGPTREYFDPIRFISNPSSGKMGFALAKVALNRGAHVTLISGPTNLTPPEGIDFISVISALEMREALLARIESQDIVIKAAAVADFQVKKAFKEKIKKNPHHGICLDLERTPDILEEIGRNKGNRFLVGFAAETEDLKRRALGKLVKKNLDLIVANDIKGFSGDYNQVMILDRDGKVINIPWAQKEEVAERILDEVVSRIKF